ncbi:hypothetical protein ACVJH7_000629 [Bradyrhizobium elkanii]
MRLTRALVMLIRLRVARYSIRASTCLATIGKRLCGL